MRHDQIVKVRPVVIPLTLASVQDFQRLEEAAHATKRYLFRFQHNNQAALKAGLLRIYQSYNLYSINSLIIQLLFILFSQSQLLYDNDSDSVQASGAVANIKA